MSLGVKSKDVLPVFAFWRVFLLIKIKDVREMLETDEVKLFNNSKSSTMRLDYTFINSQLRLFVDGVEVYKD